MYPDLLSLIIFGLVTSLTPGPNNITASYSGFNFGYKKTGNQILKESLEQAKSQGLKPQIYTHPLGTFGHSAGTTLGMWDSQDGVPFKGDFKMNFDTVYAIELNNRTYINEWNKEVRIMLEEAGMFEKDGFRYVNGRQTEIILIGKNLH